MTAEACAADPGPSGAGAAGFVGSLLSHGVARAGPARDDGDASSTPGTVAARSAARLGAAHRAGTIHRDVKPDNLLLDEAGQVTGIIDFGDMIHAPLVCDLAVPISELLVDHPEPLAAAAQIAAGYHAVTALDDAELQLIPDLSATRCAMYVAVAHWRVRDHPDNTGYIMAGVEDAATLLDEMIEWGPGRMLEELRCACAGMP